MSSVGYRPALHDGICFRCKGVGELRHQCPYGHVNPGPRSYASAVQVPAVGKSPPPQAVIKPVEGPRVRLVSRGTPIVPRRVRLTPELTIPLTTSVARWATVVIPGVDQWQIQPTLRCRL